MSYNVHRGLDDYVGDPCECNEDFGPCEMHCDILAQREGASLRTGDELALVFIDDALDIDADVLSPYGREVYNEATEALSKERHIEDADLAEALHDLARQVESHLGLWVTWEDGYVIARVTGGPLAD